MNCRAPLSVAMCVLTGYLFGIEHKIFFTSIPKSGTHLMLEALELLTDMHTIGLSTLRKNSGTCDDNESLDVSDVPGLYRFIQNKFIWFHAPWSAACAQILRKHQVKVIFMYRDPRDQQLSMFNWLNDKNLQQIPFSQFGQALVRGDLAWPKGSLVDLYHNFLQWSFEPNVYTTTFEKLIGLQGGGDPDVQFQELCNIANFLGIMVTEEKLLSIAQKIYGTGSTFKFGKIGKWRELYTDEHKTLFKVISGTLLQDLGYEQDNNW